MVYLERLALELQWVWRNLLEFVESVGEFDECSASLGGGFSGGVVSFGMYWKGWLEDGLGRLMLKGSGVSARF